jgi:hypothetical protein
VSEERRRPGARAAIAVIAVFWALSLFNIAANFFTYTFAPAALLVYEGGGTVRAGLKMAGDVAVYLVPISLFVTALVVIDRRPARRRTGSLLARAEATADGGHGTGPNAGAAAWAVLRVLLFLGVTFASLPWILSSVGVSVSDIPGLSGIFLGRQLVDGHPAVHLGAHHGWDGWLFVTLALAGSALVDGRLRVSGRLSRALVVTGCVLMFSYGVVAGAEDFVNEQLLKRGIEVATYPLLALTYASSWFPPATAALGIVAGIAWFVAEAPRKEVRA